MKWNSMHLKSWGWKNLLKTRLFHGVRDFIHLGFGGNLKKNPFVIPDTSEGFLVKTEQNAGGGSQGSEAKAMDLLVDLYKAKGVWTEMNIRYFMDGWKKADFITSINEKNVAVSVTRVVQRPFPKKFKKKRDVVHYDPDRLDVFISNLLYRKLHGMVISRAGLLGVYPNSYKDRTQIENLSVEKSILFVWTCDDESTNLVENTFKYNTPNEFKENVQLIIAQSDYESVRSDFKTCPAIVTDLRVF